MERKSLADLRQSFASGRLFHQAEAMSRHYAVPVLLIEFERDRAFALHAASELGSDPQVRLVKAGDKGFIEPTPTHSCCRPPSSSAAFRG